ncbi:hypothetical protein ACE6H2_016152 [Prunus campanulata]
MAHARLGQWLSLLVCLLILLKAESHPVGITLVENAVAKGAVCLDGSAPAYYFDKGFGAGVNNWLVHIEATNLHFRGARVFRAIIDDLLAKGMKNAHSGSAKNLPASCTSKLSPGLCFFPQNVLPVIRTPIFLLNAAYDSWQIKNILAPDIADPKGAWKKCKLDIKNCSPSQLQTMQGEYQNPPFHQQAILRRLKLIESFIGPTIGKAVGDWYHDRTPFQKTDCAYPCNPTCKNRVYNSNEQQD